MNRYIIEFTETLQKSIRIEAYILAKDMYDNQEVVLDSSHFVGFDIDVIPLGKTKQMQKIDRSELQFLREKYPKETLIKVNEMHDPINPVPPGTIGKVKCVDDAGTIHVAWENGQSLGIITGVDSFDKVKDSTKRKDNPKER